MIRILVSMMFVFPAAIQAQQERITEISPDNEYQAALSDLARATSSQEFAERSQHIVHLAEIDRPKTLAQLVWFAAHQPEVNARAVVGKALKLLDPPKVEIAATLAPLLDSSDPAIRNVSREMLIDQEDRSPSRPPDFSAYRAVIEEQVRSAKEPQASLVRHMYESDSGTALQTLVRAFQLRDLTEIKSILWAEHVVAELFWKRRYGFIQPKETDPAAVQQLEKLALHNRWWVRLYAARILATNPDLDRAESLKRLAADGNRIVREVASTSGK